MILFLFLNRVNHATSCVIKPATVRGLRSGKKTKLLFYKKFFFNHLDEEDMRYSQSRSRRYILVLNFKMYNKKFFLVDHVVTIQRKVMIVMMVVIHHQDQNLVKNLLNQLDHQNVVQGLSEYLFQSN